MIWEEVKNVTLKDKAGNIDQKSKFVLTNKRERASKQSSETRCCNR